MGYQRTGNRLRSRRKRCAIWPEPVARHLPCMRVSALSFLLLSVLPCPADQARHPQQLKSLSLEELGNIRVTIASKQPDEVRQTPAVTCVTSYNNLIAHLIVSLQSMPGRPRRLAEDRRSLLQPPHRESTDDKGSVAGIRRRL